MKFKAILYAPFPIPLVSADGRPGRVLDRRLDALRQVVHGATARLELVRRVGSDSDRDGRCGRTYT